ncbi:hypothetical protein BSL78_06533 [Apostichopus japonicus]|uniref:Uncharacterized protein n=1 Tax=Stichopus japonicus TaxID=307972 RepID=A0A2G8L8P0_STIJA|nr:hypothetical protein BSL78_06533 [Apostichopus japonicus]
MDTEDPRGGAGPRDGVRKRNQLGFQTHRPATAPAGAKDVHGSRRGTGPYQPRIDHGPATGPGPGRSGLQSVGESFRLGGRRGAHRSRSSRLRSYGGQLWHNYEPEEAPVTGGALPQELITRAADIFRRHLGFEEPETQPQKAGRVSKLTATGEASYKPKTTIPVDATCYDRFEAIANKTKWTAFPARADRAVRVPDEAGRIYLDAQPSPGGQGEIKSRTRGLIHTRVQDPGPEEARRAFGRVDMAARSGMKFASVLMLSAEVLMRTHPAP